MNNSIVAITQTPILPLSLQAAVYLHVQAPVTLREYGCITTDGSRNCSQACTLVESIFNNGSTLENCLSYPDISSYLAEHNHSSTDPAITDYGIIPGDKSGSAAIVNTVNKCLKGWANTISNCGATGGSCTGDDYGACSAYFTQSNQSSSFTNTDIVGCWTNTICQYVAANAKPSADVAGIGVYISYILQIALVIACWLVIEYFRLFHPFLTQRLQKHNYTIIRVHATRQKEIFVESVIEFHRAQCYFMSTILIASLIAANTTGLDATNLQEIFNNLELLNVLSIGGSLPVLFILFKLRLMGHRSVYTFILTSITLGLAIGLAFSSGPHKTIETDMLTPITNNIPDCGTIDPTVLCLQGLSNWSPGPGTTTGDTSALFIDNRKESIAAIAISLFLWFGLLFDKIRKVKRFEKVFGGMNKKLDNEHEAGSEKHHHSFWLRTLFGIVDFAICVGTLYLMSEYLKDLVEEVGFGPQEWTFGQLTAILIWVPPVIQYFYLQINGPEGERWHLPETLEVKRKDSQTQVKNVDEKREPSRSRSRAPAGVTTRGRQSKKNSVDLRALSLDRESSAVRRASAQRKASRDASRAIEERRGSSYRTEWILA